MHLTELVRYLNTRDRDQRPFMRLDDPFQAIPRGAIAHYARISLGSSYAPIYTGASGSLHGHAAVLRARGELNNLPLHPDAVFAIPSNDAEFIHLDRLVRTLHALNYLVRTDQQHLHVRTHLRHIENVPSGHGVVFENALRACGLNPRDITLELYIDEAPGKAARAALDAYRNRGYRIGLTARGHQWKDNHWLLGLRPDVVRLDSSLLGKPEQLNLFALRLDDYGIRSLISVRSGREWGLARDAGIELIQQPIKEEPRRERKARRPSESRVAALLH